MTGVPVPAAVGTLYDQAGHLIDRVWDESFHYGYWSGAADQAAIPDAVSRFTELMIDAMSAAPGAPVLDLGCGTGKPAVELARIADLRVTGITVSSVEVERARARAASEGLADRLRFVKCDAMAMPFADSSFDAAMALQSMMHMPSRLGALREVARVLRPLSRLALTDFYAASKLSAVDRAAVDEYCGLLQLNPELHTADGYRRLVARAGFQVDELLEIPDECSKRPSLERFADGVDAIKAEPAGAFSPEMLDAVARICRNFANASACGLLLLRLRSA